MSWAFPIANWYYRQWLSHAIRGSTIVPDLSLQSDYLRDKYRRLDLRLKSV